jgi:hypothetical protein
MFLISSQDRITAAEIKFITYILGRAIKVEETF